MIGHDEYGIDAMDGRVLRTLIETFDGGPGGLETRAVARGEDDSSLEEVYEPFLIQGGFLMRTSRGRVATGRAYKRFGYEPPAEGGAGGGQSSLFE